MSLWGFWAWVLAGSAALQSPATPSAQLALGLAVVAAALLVVVAAAGLPILRVAAPGAFHDVRRRARIRRVPRQADPDAAGRPRSRAPSAFPAAA